MIKNEDGRSYSVRTAEELKYLLKRSLESLGADEKEVIKILLKELEDGKSGLFDLMSELEYVEPVVDIETWLKEPYYFGKAHNLWPKLIDDMIELFTGDYYEVILSGSIGWGKSYFSKVALCRVFYEISCMRHPQASFGQDPNATLAVAALSVNEKLAKKVLFEDLQSMLSVSPYFKERFKPHMTQTELRFPRKVWATCASTSQNSVLGLNVIAAILDETNFMGQMSKEQKASHIRHKHVDNAELLYAAINRRIKSRFLRQGKLPSKLFLVSSKQTLGDFTERRIIEAQDDPHVFVREYSQWGAKDAKVFMPSRFNVLVGNDVMASRILDRPEDIESMKNRDDVQVIEVPEDFRDDFERDIDNAIRDIAGIATVAIMPFFRNREKIMECVDAGYRHPFTQDSWDMTEAGKFITEELFEINAAGERVPRFHPDASRHVHIDGSMRNDPTGIAVGHIYGYRDIVKKQNGMELIERRPMIMIDLLLQVKPKFGDDIIYSDIRKMIYALSEMGMPIRYVSMDSYQSFDSLQAFDSRGYDTEVISVDRPITAYDSLRGTIYDGRLKMYHYPIVLEELRRLEFNVQRKKVDHPSDGTKDVADALCGVVYTLNAKYSGESIGILSDSGVRRSERYKENSAQTWIMQDSNLYQLDDDFFNE
jgi:hypothetical protein